MTALLLCGIYHMVVYIESKAFSARLHRLAGTSALDVLNSIQADLIKNPERGGDWEGFGRHDARIRRAVRESEADSDICSCTWKTGTKFICCIYWTRTSRKTYRPMSAKDCENG